MSHIDVRNHSFLQNLSYGLKELVMNLLDGELILNPGILRKFIIQVPIFMVVVRGLVTIFKVHKSTLKVVKGDRGP